ncbi:MAG: RNA polymerase sigma factor [Calditrichaceae bacterium]
MNSADKETLFADILEQNRNRIYRLCLGYLIDKRDVDDLFQDVLVNIWRGLDSFRGEAKISTWIYRIAVNTALIHNKRTSRKKEIISSLDTDEVIDESGSKKDIRIDVNFLREKIASLKKQDRLIITLMLEGLSYREISDIVGISVNYVGVKINRIKQQLEKLINE